VDEARQRAAGSGRLSRHKPPPGATPRLSEDQRARVPELLAQGAQAHGFRGEAWTCERVAIVIRREFGVSYHPAHVSRLLKALRHSLQKPQRRANQRDEEAIEHTGKRREVATPQKRALKEGRTIVFADQSGFYLLPMVVRTYDAPVGRTPILSRRTSHEITFRR
jgi:transposase